MRAYRERGLPGGMLDRQVEPRVRSVEGERRRGADALDAGCAAEPLVQRVEEDNGARALAVARRRQRDAGDHELRRLETG